MVKYRYDAWGNHAVRDANGADIADASHIGNRNPFRYRGYYYDTETELYYLQTRYYDPETGRFITIDGIEYLDPETINGLNLYAYCGNNPVMNVDPTGTWDWDAFWRGLGMIFTAIVAVALAVTTFGAGIPLAMGIVAGVTLGAGILTGINGIAAMVEAGTGYNFVRDGVFQGNETAYNWYAGITEGVAIIGSAVLGVYHMTGQYKAAKVGQSYLGKGYSKAGKNRWISKDGFRQLRWDKGHFNLELWGNTLSSRVKNIRLMNTHIYYKMFKIITEIGGNGWFLF